MSYEMCLENAGAKVLVFGKFHDSVFEGGAWYAFVEYNGKRGWVHGRYADSPIRDDYKKKFDNTHQDPDIEERYANFGRSYLTDMIPHAKHVEILEDVYKLDELIWTNIVGCLALILGLDVAN